MADLIKNLPKPSFAIRGNKGSNFPVQGYCMSFDPLDLVNCPIFADEQNNELSTEEDVENSILMPCDLTVTIIEYAANAVFNFNNSKNEIEFIFWGSSEFYNVVYEQTVLVVYSGSHITQPIVPNVYTTLKVSDENGPRTFDLFMGSTPDKNKVILKGKQFPMKTAPHPKLADVFDYVSVYPGGTSTDTIAF
jgi:hypothetical protein